MSDFIKEELQARLGHNYQTYANILESWCRGNLSWEDLKLMVAQLMDPVTLEVHNRYISSMVSRLESDPTVSDSEPPKKRLREMHSHIETMSSMPNPSNDMEATACVQNPLDALDAFVPMDEDQTQSIAAAVPASTDTPWYGPPHDEEDGPNVCFRLGRLPTHQELASRLMSIASSYKLSQVSQDAVEILSDGLFIYVEAFLEHLVMFKRPFRCSQHFRVKPPFCNEPHPLHERLYVNPLLLQQPKLFTRRPSAELHSIGACDIFCPNSSVRSLDFFPSRSRSIRNPDSPLVITCQDMYKLVQQPEPTVVCRSNYQGLYQLIPDGRCRESIRAVLLNTLASSSECVEKGHDSSFKQTSSTPMEEVDSSDDDDLGWRRS